MNQKAIGGWGFVFAGIVFLGVGAVPLFKGGTPKTTYIILAVVFLILGAAVARRAQSGTTPPSK